MSYNPDPVDCVGIRGYTVKELCGIDHVVADRIATDSECSFQEVIAVYMFMYNYGRYTVVSALMTLLYPKGGWAIASTKKKVPAALMRIAHGNMRRRWITRNPDFCISFKTHGILEPAVQVAMDTVPVACWERRGDTYQPKYESNVLKMLAVTTLRGFIIFIGDCLYTGSTHDKAVQIHSKVDVFLRHNRYKVLADGLFYNLPINEGDEPIVVKPFTGPQIWPKYRAEGQTIAEYKAAAHEKLKENTRISFFRSRVEHVFGASMFGRWNIFKKFRSQLDLAWYCCVAAVIALNIESYNRHGRRGRYPELTPEKVEIIKRVIEGHEQQLKRYPEPELADEDDEEASTDEGDDDDDEGAPGRPGRPNRAEALQKYVAKHLPEAVQPRISDFMTQRQDAPPRPARRPRGGAGAGFQHPVLGWVDDDDHAFDEDDVMCVGEGQREQPAAEHPPAQQQQQQQQHQQHHQQQQQRPAARFVGAQPAPKPQAKGDGKRGRKPNAVAVANAGRELVAQGKQRTLEYYTQRAADLAKQPALQGAGAAQQEEDEDMALLLQVAELNQNDVMRRNMSDDAILQLVEQQSDILSRAAAAESEDEHEDEADGEQPIGGQLVDE